MGPVDGHSLQEAFKYRGCPICRKLDKDEIDFMCRFQGQTLKEEEVRRDLVASQGYCNFHFHEMARLTSPLVNAVLTKDLIDKEIEETKEAFMAGSNVRYAGILTREKAFTCKNS